MWGTDALEGGETSEAAPEAVRQAVGGGCRSGWGRLLLVTNATEAGTWRRGDSGNYYAVHPGNTPCKPPPLQKRACSIQNRIGGAECRTPGPVAAGGGKRPTFRTARGAPPKGAQRRGTILEKQNCCQDHPPLRSTAPPPPVAPGRHLGGGGGAQGRGLRRTPEPHPTGPSLTQGRPGQQ